MYVENELLLTLFDSGFKIFGAGSVKMGYAVSVTDE